jgi:hypothetical protein
VAAKLIDRIAAEVGPPLVLVNTIRSSCSADPRNHRMDRVLKGDQSDGIQQLGA